MKIRKNIAISDSGFIFNPDTGESFTANPIGLEILEMLKKGMEIKSIRKQLFDRYKTDKDSLEKDFLDFLNMLKQYKLIDHGKEEKV